MGFHDFLIALLVADIDDLFARGPHRQYMKRADSLATPRGRVDVQKVACLGGMTAPTLPCTYYSRLEDCPLNQAILAGLYLAVSLTDDRELRTALHRVIHQCADRITRLELTERQLQHLMRTNTRLTRAYDTALNLIHLLMEGMGIPLAGSATIVPLDGFLFEMNRFYQALLTKFFQENLPAYCVEPEYRIVNLFTYHPEHNPLHRQSPVVRPDFVISRHGTIEAILDAKYRDLWEHDLPREMLYQLSLYALSRGQARKATILYPTLHSEATDAVIAITPYEGTLAAQVILRPVHLLHLAEVVSALSASRSKGQREELAYRLAFGK